MIHASRTLALAGLALAACATTTLSDTWKAPNFSGPLHKVLVCALHPDDTARRQLEDAFVHELQSRGVTGIQCYGVLPPGQATEQQLREAVTTTGADGALISRVASIKEVPVYGEGPGWGPFYGAYGPAWNSVYAPGYLQTETEVNIQTKVYSAKDDGELIWFGTSRTFDPATKKDLISQIVPKFVETMEKAGVLPAPQQSQPAAGSVP